MSFPPAGRQQDSKQRGNDPWLSQIRDFAGGVASSVRRLNLEGMRPFRFVGVFPSEQEIAEWGWDSVQLTFQTQGLANLSTGFPRAFRTDRPRVCVALHAWTLNTNRMPARRSGCEDFTRLTRAAQGHSACVSTGTMSEH